MAQEAYKQSTDPNSPYYGNFDAAVEGLSKIYGVYDIPTREFAAQPVKEMAKSIATGKGVEKYDVSKKVEAPEQKPVSEVGKEKQIEQQKVKEEKVKAKLPSGVLVRDPNTKKIYFVEKNTKRHITSPDVLTPGAGFVDISPDYLKELQEGPAISQRPEFKFKSREDTEKLLREYNINL